MRKRIMRSIKAQNYSNQLMEVYKWASTFTGEDVDWNNEDISAFYRTETFKRLHFKVTHSTQNLIALVGLQGSGKTTTLKVLCRQLNIEGGESSKHMNPNYPRAWMIQWRHKHPLRTDECWGLAMKVVSEGWRDHEEKELNEMSGEKFDEFIIGRMHHLSYLFIDLPDYSKKHKGAMDRDLKAIEMIWRQLIDYRIGYYKYKSTVYSDLPAPTLIIGIQKEMCGQTFFEGKMDIVEIQPLKPSEFVEAYKQKWQTFDVITEDALLFIAQLSRGVFRRFLKYLQKSIEETVTVGKSLPITIGTVKKVVTTKQLVEDMERELSNVFKSREQKVLTVKMLTLLQERGEINQKGIAQTLDEDEMAVSRLVKTLEINGYVKRRRGDKKEWLVSLA